MIRMLATPFVFGVFFYFAVLKVIPAHLLHTQHKHKEDLGSWCGDKTKLNEEAVN